MITGDPPRLGACNGGSLSTPEGGRSYLRFRALRFLRRLRRAFSLAIA